MAVVVVADQLRGQAAAVEVDPDRNVLTAGRLLTLCRPKESGTFFAFSCFLPELNEISCVLSKIKNLL